MACPKPSSNRHDAVQPPLTNMFMYPALFTSSCVYGINNCAASRLHVILEALKRLSMELSPRVQRERA